MKEIGNASVQCQHCLSGIRMFYLIYPLYLRLRPHRLYTKSHLSWIQVQWRKWKHLMPLCEVCNASAKFWEIKSFSPLFKSMHITVMSLHSSCDSRNLNLSPFCNLTSTSLAMWQPSVLETYGNSTTDYIYRTAGPLRLNYPNSMGDRELISSLTKVCWSNVSQIRAHSINRAKSTTTLTKRTSQL